MDMQNMMMSILKSNPQFKAVMDEIQKSGKTPEELFKEKAKEKGIDPDEFMKTLQGLNIK